MVYSERAAMTEAEWLASGDLMMLEPLKGLATDRKLRLFACGCCRQVWDSLVAGRGRNAVEVAERYADGQADDAAIAQARDLCYQALHEYRGRTFGRVLVNRAWASPAELRLALAAEAAHAHRPFLIGRLRRIRWSNHDTELLPLSLLVLRDIFGNPFRPVTFSTEWRTDTAMPILADALQDAGCEDADILNHCRGPGPHVRGCWVVDLVLEKE